MISVARDGRGRACAREESAGVERRQPDEPAADSRPHTSTRVRWRSPDAHSDNLVIVPDGEGRSYGNIERLVEARETGGHWGVVIVRGVRGSSGWTHVHPGEPEAFFILEGDLELCGAETVTRVGPGTFVLVPPDAEHSFRVLSEEARWLAIWPATLDGLLEELEQARSEGRDDLQTMTAIRARHGTKPGRRIGE